MVTKQIQVVSLSSYPGREPRVVETPEFKTVDEAENWIMNLPDDPAGNTQSTLMVRTVFHRR